MASAKEHLAVEIHGRLAAHHDAVAAHHDAKSKSHSERASIHRELHRASGLSESMDGPHRRMAGQHELDAQLHKDFAEHNRAQSAAHTAAAAACMKATDPADLTKRENELQPLPTGFTRVAPSIPEAGLRPGITPVLRTGGAALQKPNVDPAFAKVFEVEADQERDVYGRPAL